MTICKTDAVILGFAPNCDLSSISFTVNVADHANGSATMQPFDFLTSYLHSGNIIAGQARDPN